MITHESFGARLLRTDPDSPDAYTFDLVVLTDRNSSPSYGQREIQNGEGGIKSTLLKRLLKITNIMVEMYPTELTVAKLLVILTMFLRQFYQKLCLILQ